MNFNKVIINNYSIDVITNSGKVNKFDKHGFSYYPLKDKQDYALKLTNDNPTRCDAHVYINNVKVGIYRIMPWSKTTITRPLNSNKKFNFTKNKSYVQRWTNVECGESSNGLVKVVFNPEAGSCGYGCIQEYDNYCSNWHKTAIGPSGPKGEVGVITPENAQCMFGPNVMDQMNAMYNNNSGTYPNAHYLPKRCDDTWGAMLGNGVSAAKQNKTQKFKNVPVLKDIDHARKTTLQARLVYDPRHDIHDEEHN